MKICDPACGVGKFLLEPILHDLHRFYKVEDGELKPQITLSGFDKGFSLSLQKEIAQKFTSAQSSQKEIIEKLDALISQKITI